jgi:hypothetical protein
VDKCSISSSSSSNSSSSSSGSGSGNGVVFNAHELAVTPFAFRYPGKILQLIE